MYMYILVVEVETQVSKKGWATVLIRVETHEKLEKLKSELNLKSFNEVINRLIEHYEKSKQGST